MTAKFAFRGKVQITHLNTRKEGPDEDKELAVDIKCEALTGREVCDFFDADLAAFLFLDHGAVRNLMLQPVEFGNELENYRVEIAGSTHYGCKVKKFRLKPKDTDQIVLTFQVSFKPSGDEIARIAEYLQDEIDIALDPANDELDFGREPIEDARNAFNRLADSVTADGGSMTISHGGEVLIGAGNDHDPMYEWAVRVAKERLPSISTIQRHLRIGYNRAARLIEQMERDGIVSAMRADGTREVIAS